ncbi:MAG: O-antigen ligase family protein [Acidobacteria bacterium]|nr:O-antigen ligase family protein [Acidobacteriota bacterium]
MALGVLLLCAAAAAQLLPVPRATLETLSPRTTALLSQYSLAFSSGAVESASLSINVQSSRTAVVALVALGLYLLGLPALLGGHTLRSMPRALAVFAVPLALFGIYSREYNNGLIYGFWQPQDGGGSDQFGPFVNRNHFGGWMLMAVCLLVGSLFGQVEGASPGRGATRRYRRLTWVSSAQANGVLLMSGAVLIAAVSLFWTLSRSAITGFGVGAAAFVWLVLTRRRLATARRAVVLAALGTALLVGVIRRGPARLVEWFQDERDLLSRLEAWRDGWGVVRDFPLFGTGLNTYPDAMLFYQHRNPGTHLAQAHNDYLQLLAEGGLLVTIPAAIALVLLARAIGRNLRAARGEARGYWIRAGAAVGLTAIAVQEVFEFSLQIPANALLFCTLAAVALTPVKTGTGSVTVSRDNIDILRDCSDVSLP